ncbi:hypothetical protein DICPUDRAFT_99878 [Dictyostelium purpureum]|uniref:Oxysterol binding family protein n=1 Tax=Dictyostelium purpureum TaxID=5786 RepID=F1A3D4_DICPU|nr:uncharacterized protein DICPUDRAFT_99878 [Dictyostelium purpureum]EGC29297.1 hypothetical protein DICPUDRAFT_99878 [Dictyostelium purpureum]|eukprot:XP_003294180.1 hypothetical protein DICPUDRAFT_99878 [Dictyostelium purpureum]
MSDNNHEEINDSKRAIIAALLKQVKLNKEIKHMVLPSFLLQTRSTLESFTDMYSYIDELYRVNEIENEQDRFVQFVKFYLSGWHTRPKGIKKPFNPVIGEQYECYWSENKEEDLKGIDNLINEKNKDIGVFKAEQISHHPPISSYVFYNTARQILVNGNICPSYVKYLGNSAESHLQGILEFKFLKFNEVYECSLPTLGARGIVLGKLATFTSGEITIRSTSGGKFRASLEFLYKGLFGSSKNSNGVKGTLYNGDTPIFKIRGNWDKTVFIQPCNKNGDLEQKENVLFDVKQLKKSNEVKFEKPLDQQPPNSSYHLWEKVTKKINEHDDQGTAEEKKIIEDKQRREEAERVEKGIHWEPKDFQYRPHDGEYKDTYYYKYIPMLFENYESKPVQ